MSLSPAMQTLIRELAKKAAAEQRDRERQAKLAGRETAQRGKRAA